MGVLTDFVVADRADAKRVGDSSNPSRNFGGIMAKGIDQVKMGRLYAILTGTEYDCKFMATESSFIYSRSDDGPWVQVVPDDMVLRLAKLTEPEIANIASEWGKTEEFEQRFSSWRPDNIAWFLREIVTLSRQAVASGKSVLMWTCL